MAIVPLAKLLSSPPVFKAIFHPMKKQKTLLDKLIDLVSDAERMKALPECSW